MKVVNSIKPNVRRVTAMFSYINTVQEYVVVLAYEQPHCDEKGSSVTKADYATASVRWVGAMCNRINAARP